MLQKVHEARQVILMLKLTIYDISKILTFRDVTITMPFDFL